MKVYILRWNTDYDGSLILGVFSSELNAKEAILKLEDFRKNDVIIEEYFLDKIEIGENKDI